MLRAFVPVIVLACAALSTALAQNAPPPAAEGQWSEPPGPLTQSDRALLAQAQAALDHDGVSAVLTDPRFTALHPRPEFREAVRAHATTGPLTIASKQEPGERLIVTCTVKSPDGAPIAGAEVYLYHTSAKGWYAADGAHVRADSGDHKHARLFGYTKTDAQGRLELRTIRPGGYPRSTLPQHIHIWVSAPGFDTLGTELLFEDDPRLDAQQRERANAEGFVIARAALASDDNWRIAYELTVRPGGNR